MSANQIEEQYERRLLVLDNTWPVFISNDLYLKVKLHEMDIWHDFRCFLLTFRYGKPVVFNMMKTSVDVMYPRLVETLDAVKPGLMKAIIDKEFLKED